MKIISIKEEPLAQAVRLPVDAPIARPASPTLEPDHGRVQHDILLRGYASMEKELNEIKAVNERLEAENTTLKVAQDDLTIQKNQLNTRIDQYESDKTAQQVEHEKTTALLTESKAQHKVMQTRISRLLIKDGNNFFEKVRLVKEYKDKEAEKVKKLEREHEEKVKQLEKAHGEKVKDLQTKHAAEIKGYEDRHSQMVYDSCNDIECNHAGHQGRNEKRERNRENRQRRKRRRQEDEQPNFYSNEPQMQHQYQYNYDYDYDYDYDDGYDCSIYDPNDAWSAGPSGAGWEDQYGMPW